MTKQVRRQFNLETQSWEEFEEEEPTALELLQRTYRDVAQPLSVRLRAAIESFLTKIPSSPPWLLVTSLARTFTTALNVQLIAPTQSSSRGAWCRWMSTIKRRRWIAHTHSRPNEMGEAIADPAHPYANTTLGRTLPRPWP